MSDKDNYRERNKEKILRTDTKIKRMIKSDNFTRSNRGISNIAVAILNKKNNLFCILGAPIIFSPTLFHVCCCIIQLNNFGFVKSSFEHTLDWK